jgi:hypothetical protein
MQAVYVCRICGCRALSQMQAGTTNSWVTGMWESAVDTTTLPKKPCFCHKPDKTGYQRGRGNCRRPILTIFQCRTAPMSFCLKWSQFAQFCCCDFYERAGRFCEVVSSSLHLARKVQVVTPQCPKRFSSLGKIRKWYPIERVLWNLVLLSRCSMPCITFLPHVFGMPCFCIYTCKVQCKLAVRSRDHVCCSCELSCARVLHQLATEHPTLIVTLMNKATLSVIVTHISDTGFNDHWMSMNDEWSVNT